MNLLMKIKELWTIWNTPIQNDAKKEIASKLSWDENAYALLIQFTRIQKKKKHRFTHEDFGAYCLKKGLNSPPHPNKWGALFSKASAKGLITNTGLSVTSSNPSSKSRRISVWR